MNDQQNLHSGSRWEPRADGSTDAATYASSDPTAAR
ncbi:MAG: hypothetical protein JWP61_2930, partial [Friedmanniella sp.]|nr:hypothetical protein [Friedmanniella sp.]